MALVGGGKRNQLASDLGMSSVFCKCAPVGSPIAVRAIALTIAKSIRGSATFFKRTSVGATRKAVGDRYFNLPLAFKAYHQPPNGNAAWFAGDTNTVFVSNPLWV